VANGNSKLEQLLVKLDELDPKLDDLKSALEQFIEEKLDQKLREREAKGRGDDGTV
jgi:hypothetical protein